jgi:4-aminobutyrate aminotransferase/(S)-3-amino-2-methylpropionate transaminase
MAKRTGAGVGLAGEPAATPQLHRHLRTALPGPRSLELQQRRAAAVAPGVTSTLGLYVAGGRGAIVVDVDGNELIDLGSGIAVTSVGHAAPGLVAAVQDQVAAFAHSCFMVSPYEGYVAVCEALNARMPGAADKRSALFNSGAEAVENAVKIARHATGRRAVIAFDHAYHGRTNLTMGLTAKNMPYKHGFGPFAGEIYRVPTSYPLRDPAGMTGAEAADRALGIVEAQVGASNVACLIIEPIQGEGGFIVPAPGFMAALADWCAQHGALFVADEVQTGFCRTGSWFACEHEGVEPDLVTTAKGIAGGLPLAGVTGRADLVGAVHPGGLGGTYGGNPVACAAALATIEQMERDDLAARARAIGEAVRERLEPLVEAHDGIAELRGRGAMMAIELVRPGGRDPDPAATREIVAACHAAGVIVLSCGTDNNVIRLLPPLVIEPDQLEEGLGVLSDAIAATL